MRCILIGAMLAAPCLWGQESHQHEHARGRTRLCELSQFVQTAGAKAVLTGPWRFCTPSATERLGAPLEKR